MQCSKCRHHFCWMCFRGFLILNFFKNIFKRLEDTWKWILWMLSL